MARRFCLVFVLLAALAAAGCNAGVSEAEYARNGNHGGGRLKDRVDDPFHPDDPSWVGGGSGR